VKPPCHVAIAAPPRSQVRYEASLPASQALLKTLTLLYAWQVIGGSGDYFDVADKVVMMESFAPRDVTDEAIAIGRRFATPEADAMAAAAAAAPFGSVAQRVVACVCDAPVEKVG